VIPRSATPPPQPRGPFNRFVQICYLVAGIVIPSLLILWATTLVPIPGAGAARVLLFFLVLPVFFVYIGIVVLRFFPHSTLGALGFFLPLVINLVLYSLSFRSARAFAIDYMLSSLPIFLGFMLLLLVGLTLLIVANTSLSTIREATVSFAIVILGAAPVVFTAILGYRLNVTNAVDPHDSWRIIASYVSSIGLVFYLHIRPIKQLYAERAL
jgi:hypothetical protein